MNKKTIILFSVVILLFLNACSAVKIDLQNEKFKAQDTSGISSGRAVKSAADILKIKIRQAEIEYFDLITKGGRKNRERAAQLLEDIKKFKYNLNSLSSSKNYYNSSRNKKAKTTKNSFDRAWEKHKKTRKITVY